MRRADGVVVGADALDRLGEELDELADRVAVPLPLTARRPWLSAWARAFTFYEPVVVRVPGAWAPLAVRSRAGLLRVVALGHGVSDYSRLPAVDAEAAVRLGDRVAEVLAGIGRPWVLDLEQLPVDDPAVTALCARLPVHRLEEGDGSPMTRFVEGRAVETYLSGNFRGSVRRKLRRVEAAGTKVEVAFERGADAVQRLLPELEQVRRRRDEHVGRVSALDTEAGTRFYRDVMAGLAARGEVEIATLRFDGRLAAYVVSLLDGPVYRSYDPRIEPAFAEHSPGMVLEVPLFERLLADPAIECFDRMRGVEAYKLRTSNHVEPATRLRAWSSTGVRRVDDGWRRAKRELKQSARVRSVVAAIERSRRR